MKRIFRNRTFSWKTDGVFMRRNVYLCKTGAKTALFTLMRNGRLSRFEVAKTPFTERKHGT